MAPANLSAVAILEAFVAGWMFLSLGFLLAKVGTLIRERRDTEESGEDRAHLSPNRTNTRK